MVLEENESVEDEPVKDEDVKDALVLVDNEADELSDSSFIWPSFCNTVLRSFPVGSLSSTYK